MELVLESNGLKLIKKYDRYYIRFIGGQMDDMICDLGITNKDAMTIISNHESIKPILDEYSKQVSWTKEYFIDNMIKEYMFYEVNMSEKRINLNIQKLNRHTDIKNELYFTISNEKFPVEGAISVCGYTAQKLKETTRLSILGSYNYLIYLREDEKNALTDLQKGLPIK